jgi:hypothetical protein
MALILKRASASRASGEWNGDDFDVLADGVVVGRIFHAAAAPVGTPWLWTLADGHHEDRTPTHGYEPRREAAMAAWQAWAKTVGPSPSMCSLNLMPGPALASTNASVALRTSSGSRRTCGVTEIAPTSGVT